MYVVDDDVDDDVDDVHDDDDDDDDDDDLDIQSFVRIFLKETPKAISVARLLGVPNSHRSSPGIWRILDV